MATTASGLTIPGSSPTTTAATPIQDHWNNLGKSLNGRVVVPVASVTARAALVTALTAEGYTISTSNPLYTHRTDASLGSELEVTTDGSTWRAVVQSVIFAGNKMGAPLTSGTFYGINGWATTINKNVTITGSHIIPLKPGYYKAKVRAQWNPNEFGMRLASVNLNSNGVSTANQLTAASTLSPTVSTTPYPFNQETDSLVLMNGTTDYIEAFAMQNSGYTISVNIFVELTWFSAP